jgi:hypothetical protein
LPAFFGSGIRRIGGIKLRILRGALVAATAVALTGALSPGAAQAAAPAAPYDAFTADGTAVSRTLDAGNATFNLGMSGPGVNVDAFGPNNTHLAASLQPPTGTQLSVGTFDTLRIADATHAGFDVAVDSSGCGDTTGTITIHEITRDPDTNAVTALAITYAISCTSLKGEIRWHSSVGYKSATASPTFLSWTAVSLGEVGPEQIVTLTGTGSLPITIGDAALTGTDASSFTVSANGCAGAVLDFGETCQVRVRPSPVHTGELRARLAVSDDSSSGPRSSSLSSFGRIGAKGSYFPLPPQRILDTRSGLGAPKAPVGPAATVHLQVTGRGGVPATGVGAVVLNVTITAPTASGFLTAFPTGTVRPTASSLNFVAGWTRANSVMVSVGIGGKVDLFNSNGFTHVIADVTGYYPGNDDNLMTIGVGGQLQPTIPERLLDTRTDFGTKLPAGFFVVIPVSYGAAADPHIRALAVNITAVDPTRDGFLTAWNGTGALPNTSSVNYTTRSVVPNTAVVPVAPCQDCGGATGLPSIGVFTNQDTHVLVDIVGFFDDGTLSDGLRFRPQSPVRIVDSRVGQGIPAALGPVTTATVTAPDSVLPPDAFALALNVTAVNPTSSSFITVWPDGIPEIPQPGISNLNPRTGQTAPNGVITLVGPENRFNVYNSAGTVHVLVDVAGHFYLYPGTASTSPSIQSADAALRAGGGFQLTRFPVSMRRHG